MGTVTTNDGVSLHWTEEGSGPTVLLIAGYTAAATSWVFQVEALVAAGFRAVALDRRSHGESDAPEFGQRISRHAKDVRDVIEALDLHDVVLVGGSMGASTIWSYIDLFGTDRVRGIVSVDQTPRMINGDGWDHGFYGFTDENAGTLFRDGVPQTGRGLGAEQALPALMRLVERLGGADTLRHEVRPETLPLLRDHAQQDWRDVIARVDVPVLMVAARDSQVWPAEHAAASVQGNPLGRSVVLDDCGHAANIDQPEAFNAALVDFLGLL
jgi:non-heme chloroperoxidase